MSVSNSSAPRGARAAAAPEALGLTVHAVDALDLASPALAARTRSGRLQMLLVLLACAAPVVASYLAYFVVRPQARSNYGALVSPPRPLPQALPLRRVGDGASVPAESLRGQWLLVVVGPAACDGACERRLFLQRQLREMLGRERDRVDKLWLVEDDGPVAPSLLRAVAEGAAPASVLRVDRAALARWLEPEAGHALDEHLYVVDPRGDWMMRMPADPDPARVKRDLERLLRASAGWDRPGR